MYSAKRDWENWRNVGFEVFPEMLTMDNADTAIARAASEANVEFVSVLHSFRTEAQRQPLYYKFDGHFNPDGHRIFAQLIALKIAPILQAIEQEKSETP
ncbi:MAG: SGNH/GDSL hydrolase family protein [Kiritimatiellae bacterium]|nr:SGNH/GDSL hydrolase family protein [Kiritimatiellia bacterium]